MKQYSIEKLIKENNGTVIDVRTVAEFMGGHVDESINIPLDEIPTKLEQLKSLPTPLILCCASGGRSGNAEIYLSQMGIECLNGGSWLDVNYYKNTNA